MLERIRSVAPETRKPTFTMDRVSKTYPGVAAISDLTLRGFEGEVLAICGANGAGKSTLVRLLAGQEQPSSGTVGITGYAKKVTDPSDALDAGVLLMHQEPVIIDSFTLEENVWLEDISASHDRKAWHRAGSGRTQLTQDALIAVGLSGMDIKSPAGTLGPGPRQMLALSRAQVVDHRILLLDETTASSTEAHFKDVANLVQREREAGATVVFVSHRMPEVFALADRIAVMRNGRLVDVVERAATTPDEIMTMMIGESVRALEAPAPFHALPGDVPALEVRGLSSGSATNFNLSVYRGEVVGIYGLVGSGRSSIARSISGHQGRATGDLLVHGSAVDPQTPRAAMREKIVYVSEDRRREGFVKEFDNAQNLTIGSLERFSRRGLLDLRREQRRASELVKEFGVKGGAHVLTRTLSGGNQQKICIAQGLEADPDIVILDEPTKGIDVGARLNIYEIVQGLARQGKAIIIVTSEAEEALSICNRVVVLRDGRQVGDFESATCTTDDLTRSALGGDIE